MENLWAWILVPFKLFLWSPGRIVAVSLVFAAGYIAIIVRRDIHSRFRGWPPLVASVLWGLYAVWESIALEKKWNIRVDLLLIAPALLTISVAALVLSYRWKRPPE